MRVDDRGTHYADCIFCGLEWIVSSQVKDPYTCPYCRALYKKLKPTNTKKARKKK